MTTNDPKQHLRFHNLSILKISQSYSVLSKTDQLLDHPLGYFYETDLSPGLNLPECSHSLYFADNKSELSSLGHMLHYCQLKVVNSPYFDVPFLRLNILELTPCVACICAYASVPQWIRE